MNSEYIFQFVRKIENVGNILQSSNNEEIKETEKLIHEFHNLPLKPLECLKLFGASGHSFVHFQICKLLKTSINTNWASCAKHSLLNQLFFHIRALNNSPHHVKQTYLQVAANVYKRMRMEHLESPSRYTVLQGLLSHADPGLNHLSLSLMHFIVEEFSEGLEKEEWLWLKESFEEEEMMKFYAWYKEFIVKETSKPASLPTNLLNKVLENILAVFSWDFSKFSAASYSFKPSTLWISLLFEEDIFGLFLQLSLTLRHKHDSQVCLALQCVCQLATAELPTLFSAQLVKSVEHFYSQYMQLEGLSDEEVLCLSCTLSNLTSFQRPLSVLTSLQQPSQLLSDVCLLLVSLSSRPLSNDSPLKQAYSNLIEAFYHLSTTAFYSTESTQATLFIRDHYTHFSSQIFSSFLRGRVSEGEKIDRVAFNDVMFYVGCIGRGALKENFIFAVNLLISKSQAFSHAFSSKQTVPNEVCESLQWLVCQVGYLLVDCMEEGFCELPRQVMRATAAWSNNHENPFVMLLQWVEEFVKLEEETVWNDVGKGKSETVGLQDCFIELLQKLCSAYLLFREEDFESVSLCIFEVFAADTDSAHHITMLFVKALCRHMEHWTGERSSVRMLEDLLNNRHKRKVAETSWLFEECIKQHQLLIALMLQQDE